MAELRERFRMEWFGRRRMLKCFQIEGQVAWL